MQKFDSGKPESLGLGELQVWEKWVKSAISAIPGYGDRLLNPHVLLNRNLHWKYIFNPFTDSTRP